MYRLIPVFLFAMLAVAQPPVPAPAPGGQPGRGGAIAQGRGRSNSQNSTPQRPATKPEDLAAIEGQIVNGATGEPLGKARISLRRSQMERDAMGLPGSYSATSDPSGKFVIPNVEPGSYRLSVSRTGYVDADYGSRDYLTSGTPFDLSTRQRKNDINVRLTPNAVVTGKVVDEDGEPMQGLQVEAMRYRYANGSKQLAQFAQSTSNDIGEYRISGLPPGRYFIAVTPRSRGNFGPPGRTVPTQPPPAQDYVQTFFPGSNDPATAVPMDLSPGAQMRGIDFRMAKRPIVTIRGQLAGVTQGSRQRPMVSLHSRNQAGSGVRPAMVDSNGHFEIRGVTPGAYNLIAAIPIDRRMMSARIPLEVGSSNIDNLTINIPPPVNLTGRVRIDGQQDATATAALANVQVMVRSRDAGPRFGGSNAPAKLQPDGSFTISSLSADRYRLSIANIPDGYYIKSAQVGDQDVLVAGLDLTRGVVLPVDVVLRANAGQADGVVQNDQSQPAPGVTVVLVPQEPERRESPLHYKTATADDSGHFLLKNLYPGSYKVYAWSEIESGVYMDPDFMRQFENAGESITIKEGSSEKIQAKLIR